MEDTLNITRNYRKKNEQSLRPTEHQQVIQHKCPRSREEKRKEKIFKK